MDKGTKRGTVRLALAAGVGMLAILSTSACSTLPSAGPSTNHIVDKSTEASQSASLETPGLIRIDSNAVSALASSEEPGLAAAIKTIPSKAPNRIGVGDSLSIAVYESNGAALFSGNGVLGSGGEASAPQAPTDKPEGAQTSKTQLPAITVDDEGYVSVPYAGRIKAAGLTAYDVESAIAKKLKGQAIKPQVSVSVSKPESSTVTVAGEVGQGARFQLSPAGERLLDAIARAGGPKGSSFDTYVRLSRDGQSGTIGLSTLLKRDSDNVWLKGGDSVFVYRQPKTFSAFGALGRNAHVEFDADSLSLAEAIAKGWGLNDFRADAHGVFLFRLEDPAIAGHLGVKGTGPGKVPVAYHLDMGKAGAFLLASSFQMRDKDILYVSDSDSMDVQKAFMLIGGSVGTVGTSATLAK